jgi:competence protein ComEA
MKSESKRRKKQIALLMAAAVVAALAFGSFWMKLKQADEKVLSNSEISRASQKKGGAETSKIMVHVAGAVNRPGLYRLSPNARVNDAIAAAGGARADGDVNALNLAEKLKDGQKLTVPDQSASAQTANQNAAETATVNINTASKETLMTLPGIGDVLAQNIIDYRTKNGPFSSAAEIKEVNRIGDKLYEQLKDRITV